MTPLQYGTLKFIDQYASIHGMPPTQKEIAEHLGSSAPYVCLTVKRLEKRGYLLKEGGWRTLRVIKMPASWAA